MKRIACITTFLILIVSGVAFAGEPSSKVKLTTTKGDIVVELNRAAAPKTVDNFIAYVRDGFYDGTIFHRVIAGFMIQGGGFDAEMQRKATRPPIANEADNGLSNQIGTIAMARTSDPHSASAQFFINVKDNIVLDHRGKNAKGWGYCVFGKVVEGMNVVRDIEHVPTTMRNGVKDVPETPVVITKAVIFQTK